MLNDHADLKLTIEGHTDNVGRADANQALERKAGGGGTAVSDRRYQMDGSRLMAKGWARASRPRPTARRKAGSRTGGWSWSRLESGQCPARDE